MSWVRQRNDGKFEIAEMIFGGIIPIILIVLGTIGNIICIIYLSQQSYRRSPSTNIYLIFLCIADTLSLYQWNLNYIVMEFSHGYQLSDRSIFLCKSITFLSFYTLHLSAFFLCLVAIDRTLILWSRNYKRMMRGRRNAFIVSLITIVVLLSLDSFLFSLGFTDEETGKVICYQSRNSNLMIFYKTIFPWIHLIVMYIVPFTTILIGATLIILKLYIYRVQNRQGNQKQQFSVILVGICILYIVLTLPNRLCFSVFLNALLNHVYTDTILLASNALLYTRNAANFFLLFAVSSVFRRRFIRIVRITLCICSQYRMRNQIFPALQLNTFHRTRVFHIST